MNPNIENAIQESIDNLEENERIISHYRESYHKVLEKQQNLFLEMANKISPILSHFKKQGYEFYNSKLNCHSNQGPIIGFKDNKIYTYSGEGLLVTCFDLITKKSESIFLKDFLMNNSLKNAMEGLLEVALQQTKTILEFQNEIDKAESELNQFNY